MAARKKKGEAFEVSEDDPLAAEHAAVSAWVEEAFASRGEHDYYQETDLKSLPTGRALLEGKPEESRRLVLAAVAQLRHWDRRIAELVRSGKDDFTVHNSPQWAAYWGRRGQGQAVLNALMRRTLPFGRDDFAAFLAWGEEQEHPNSAWMPIGSIVRALERYASANELDPELRGAIGRFAARLRGTQYKEARRFATPLEQLGGSSTTETSEGPAAAAAKPAPKPAPAGTPGILDSLKQALGMMPDAQAPAVTPIEPDLFPLREDSPLRQEHALLGELFEEWIKEFDNRLDGRGRWPLQMSNLETGRRIFSLEPRALGRVVLAAAERNAHAIRQGWSAHIEAGVQQARSQMTETVALLVSSNFTLDRDGLFDLILYVSSRPSHEHASVGGGTIRNLIEQAETHAADSPLTEGERYVLSRLRGVLITGPPLGVLPERPARLTGLIDDGADFYLVPDEPWAVALNADIAGMPSAKRSHWIELLRHALTATSAKPSAKWLKTAGALAQKIGGDEVREALLRWLPLVSKPSTIKKLPHYQGDTRSVGDLMNEENATCLRGLLWTIQALPGREALTRAIASVAVSAYRKVPGIGPRAVKVGNSAVYALSELGTREAVGQLAMLKVRVKFGTAQKEIEKAFRASAEALGLPQDQVEELGVPTYGLEDVGIRREPLGDSRAELVVTGTDAELRWFDAKGKRLKSVPARVKADHKEELKELQEALKDIQSMLPAQRDRIDAMFLQQRAWPIADWRERYLDHPLVGTIARRLIWCVDGAPALFLDGSPADVRGEPIAHGETAEITPWHPVGRAVDEITAWRRRLEELGVTQPFKQAHREVYPLTDAERNTRTYSNRFAAHILRQHQFNALCAARGWKNKLRLMVDDTYPPATRELPGWGIRAEFWIEGIGDDYGVDTNDAGVYLRLATDQVRFYRTDAAQNWAHAGGGGYGGLRPGQAVSEPLPLDQVPPLVFSEIMRDVDLFVGVGSVGNDPAWQDGGPEGRHRAYWHDYAFGELSGTASTRKQVLERLVPRLKIAARCSFSDRFLVVRGEKRTYKIHLGSGNILMEPNDQYLCIVPDARARAKPDDLFLPFEGDNTLSIILSKAFLLAEDAKIEDPTITRQIDAR